MNSNSRRLQRRSIRLPDYDYAQGGAYFVTICTQQRELYFENSEMKNIAEICWLHIPIHNWEIELDQWVVMPNHLHGILVLTDRISPQKQTSEKLLR